MKTGIRLCEIAMLSSTTWRRAPLRRRPRP